MSNYTSSILQNMATTTIQCSTVTEVDLKYTLGKCSILLVYLKSSFRYYSIAGYDIHICWCKKHSSYGILFLRESSTISLLKLTRSRSLHFLCVCSVFMFLYLDSDDQDINFI